MSEQPTQPQPQVVVKDRRFNVPSNSNIPDHLIILAAFLACLIVYVILRLHGQVVNRFEDLLFILVGALAALVTSRKHA